MNTMNAYQRTTSGFHVSESQTHGPLPNSNSGSFSSKLLFWIHALGATLAIVYYVVALEHHAHQSKTAEVFAISHAIDPSTGRDQLLYHWSDGSISAHVLDYGKEPVGLSALAGLLLEVNELLHRLEVGGLLARTEHYAWFSSALGREVTLGRG